MCLGMFKGKGSGKTVVGSIDQGTQSTKFTIYDNQLNVVGESQHEHKESYPNSGWAEHDALEIWDSTSKCIQDVLKANSGVNIVGIGITNQRETIVAWDKATGKPLHKAIVWHDLRTAPIVKELADLHGGVLAFRDTTGLPLNTYFSAVKILWLLRNSPEVKAAHEKGTVQFGTIDSWVIYNLTGGASGGVHVTDVTNASRTFLMDVKTCQWSDKMLKVFGVKKECLATIKSSAEVYGMVKAKGLPGALQGVPVAGCLGDQQAACVGQGLFDVASTKCTMGTGAFILQNTGTKIVKSDHGLLTTPCYQLGAEAPVIWALEGSIAVAGQGVSWMKNNLGLFNEAKETEAMLKATPDTEGVYLVPAFSGLYAPRWRDDARGAFVGLTLMTTKNHIVRAMCEGICFQINEVVEAMLKDSGKADGGGVIAVDGGIANNKTFLQILSDIANSPIERPANVEVTAVGAAIAAGLGVGMWPGINEVKSILTSKEGVANFKPQANAADRKKRIAHWNEAVERSLNWVE